MSFNASGKFNLAVFGVILLAFTTEHQFQSVFWQQSYQEAQPQQLQCLPRHAAGQESC